MTIRLRWHRTLTIALAAAFVLAVLVHEREVTLLTHVDADRWPVGWLAVLAAGALCFACGVSFRSAQAASVRHRLRKEVDDHDAGDDQRHAGDRGPV